MGDSNSLSLDMALRTTLGAWANLLTSYMAWGKALRDIVGTMGSTDPFWFGRQGVGSPFTKRSHALRLVEQYTSIPAPRVADVVENLGKMYLIMTRLHGQLLAVVWHLMSYAERSQLADDPKACIAQVQKAPNNMPYEFGNTIGGPYIDHRIPDGSAGLFNSESEFYAHLTSHLSGTLATIFPERSICLDLYSHFTHSDLHPLNLLADRGRLSGIVDWECASAMPEYWEFTKAMYGTRTRGVFEHIFYRAFGRAYEYELEVGRKLWTVTPFGV